MLVTGACTSDSASSGARPRRIPQPVVTNPDLAPLRDRVDLRVPTFSHPTDVTNPLFPVSRQESVLFVGHVDGEPFRTEVTLLPDTRIVEWEGQRIETLVSQYVAFLGGRLQEVAYDLYAQADDGSVWYFGEDVADLEQGAIVTKEGTWIVGKDGPAAMIMPAHPRVGDAYRTENIPGIAFEEITVRTVDRTLDGPLGPIAGGVTASEFHLTGGNSERKTFAPGYGEFLTTGAGDVEALALAVPTDAAAGPMPPELEDLSARAIDVFRSARSLDWTSVSDAMRVIHTAWTATRSDGAPGLIVPELDRSLDSLQRAVVARDARQTRRLAIDVARWSDDLQLRYRPAVQVDLARFGLWAAQVAVDVEGRSRDGVNGDAFTLDYIRDRILRALDPVERQRLDVELDDLQAAALDGRLVAAARAAARLRALVAPLTPVGAPAG
jgi:hypothetical protein